jgi:hypothetical protein
MTIIKTYVCDLCKEEGKKKDMAKVHIENGYHSLDFDIHVSCLERVGILVPAKNEEVIDQSWMTGGDGNKPPPIVIQGVDMGMGVSITSGTCPRCALSFELPANVDPEDVTCPGCGYSYKDEANAP